MGDWTLFSNHGHVLLYLAGHTEARLRDVAGDVGITERAVQKIVRELQDAGYLSVTKRGRCNRYRIHGRKSLRHPIESHCTLSRLVRLIVKPPHGSEELDAAAVAPVPVPKPEDGAPARSGPKPEPWPQSEPKAKSEAKPAARSEAKPEAKPETKAETPASKPATGAAKGKDGDDEPAERRQQGSLF